VVKKIFKSLLCSLLVLTVLCAMAGTALAAGIVTYDGNAREFIFIPGSDASPTDLFESFKDVMPGDSITEQIFIRNDISKDVKIRVYMRSLGAQEGTDDFLSQLSLTVTQVEDTLLFDAPANETAQLTDWVYLGTLYSGGEVTLNVTLDVPITLGNEYADSIGYINWQFMVEELPVEPSHPKPPQTGDTSNVYLYAGLMGFSFVALILLLILFKRRKKKEQ